MDKSYLSLMLTNPAEIACQFVFHMDFQQMHTFKDLKEIHSGLNENLIISSIEKVLFWIQLFLFLIFVMFVSHDLFMSFSARDVKILSLSLNKIYVFFPISPCRLLFWTMCLDVCLFFFFYNFKYLVILFNNLSPQNFNCQCYHNIEYWIMILFFSSFY